MFPNNKPHCNSQEYNLTILNLVPFQDAASYARYGDLTKFFESPLAASQNEANSGKYDPFAQSNTIVLHSAKLNAATNPSAENGIIGRAVLCGVLGLIVGIAIIYANIIKMLTIGAILLILVCCFMVGVLLGIVFGVLVRSAISTQNTLTAVIDTGPPVAVGAMV